MSLKTLHTGAILVADSHCAAWRTPFLNFLESLERSELKTTQLILMGDNFDLLFGPVEQTLRWNHEAVTLLNRLAKKIEIVYLEGNHDFRLASLFPDIEVVDRAHQPLIVQFENRRVALLHGDIDVPLGYELYTKLIRNRAVLYLLNGVNRLTNGAITGWLEKAMKRKNHCKKIENMEAIAARHIGKRWSQECDFVIEGHYHQNRTFEFGTFTYYNLGAFACNERYYVVKSSQNQTILDEAIFCKEPE